MSQTTPAAVTGISTPVHLTLKSVEFVEPNRFSGIQTAPPEPGQNQGFPGAKQSPDSVRRLWRRRSTHHQSPRAPRASPHIQPPGQKAICAILRLFSILHFMHGYFAFECGIKIGSRILKSVFVLTFLLLDLEYGSPL